MEDIGFGTICLVGVGLLLLFMLLRGRGGKNAPAGTYDSDRARSGGSFGGADAQRTTDSEKVQSGGSFGGGPTGAVGQRTNDDAAVRGGGSFGGGQRVEDNDRPSRVRAQDNDGASRASLGSRERGAPVDAKVENTIPKRPQGRSVAPDSSDSPFPILRDRLGDADETREGRMSSTLGNRPTDADDAVSRLADRAEGRDGPSARLGNRAAPRRDDDDDSDGDSDRVRSGGSFGG